MAVAVVLLLAVVVVVATLTALTTTTTVQHAPQSAGPTHDRVVVAVPAIRPHRNANVQFVNVKRGGGGGQYDGTVLRVVVGDRDPVSRVRQPCETIRALVLEQLVCRFTGRKDPADKGLRRARKEAAAAAPDSSSSSSFHELVFFLMVERLDDNKDRGTLFLRSSERSNVTAHHAAVATRTHVKYVVGGHSRSTNRIIRSQLGSRAVVRH